MQSKGLWSLLVAVGIVLVLGAQADAQMAKQGTYAGNFGWYAIGKTFELEKDHAFWVGEFSGTFFNEAGQGFLHGTSWVCPGVNDLTNGASTASQGYCVVTDKEGDKAFLVEFIPIKPLAATELKRTRKLWRAQHSSITRSRTPSFQSRFRSFTMRQRLTLLLTCSIRKRDSGGLVGTLLLQGGS